MLLQREIAADEYQGRGGTRLHEREKVSVENVGGFLSLSFSVCESSMVPFDECVIRSKELPFRERRREDRSCEPAWISSSAKLFDEIVFALAAARFPNLQYLVHERQTSSLEPRADPFLATRRRLLNPNDARLSFADEFSRGPYLDRYF